MSAPCKVVARDAIADGLVEATVTLIERVTGNAPTVFAKESARDVRIEAPLTFPDGIGSGSVIVHLHAREQKVGLEMRLEHDRVFATPQRTASSNRCFLNDYVASITMCADAEALPETFVRQVVAGVSAARYAVERHNREHPAPWFRIRVAARDSLAFS